MGRRSLNFPLSTRHKRTSGATRNTEVPRRVVGTFRLGEAGADWALCLAQRNMNIGRSHVVASAVVCERCKSHIDFPCWVVSEGELVNGNSLM